MPGVNSSKLCSVLPSSGNSCRKSLSITVASAVEWTSAARERTTTLSPTLPTFSRTVTER